MQKQILKKNHFSLLSGTQMISVNEKKIEVKISWHSPFKALLLLLAVDIVSAGAVTVHAVAKCDAAGDAALGDADVGDVAVDDADMGDVAVGNATV